ncbi:hypothetical protein [Bradyrhizobium ottawaense]|uniref:hypothetical protein n=1 Tax=Bradyrhizobium ottawaense TaxID=931866 RepID=UPI003835BE33
MAEQDPKTGRFLPGNSGNGGRHKGARNKLHADFIQALLDHFHMRGPGRKRGQPSAWSSSYRDRLP